MPTAPAWHAPPSAFDGFAVQVDEIGGRRSAVPGPAWTMPVGVSSLKTGAVAPPSKCPVKVRFCPPTFSCQLMYGVLPENVMSGRVASFSVFEIGWPELNSSKWSPPTRRETKIACVGADRLGPGDPRHRRPSGSQRAGGDARILGVDGGVLVERARALLAERSPAQEPKWCWRRWCRARWSARPCRCRPRPSGSHRRRRRPGRPWRRTPTRW